jgi:hypothetical protein
MYYKKYIKYKLKYNKLKNNTLSDTKQIGGTSQTLKILSWNIQKFDYSHNPFEFIHNIPEEENPEMSKLLHRFNDLYEQIATPLIKSTLTIEQIIDAVVNDEIKRKIHDSTKPDYSISHILSVIDKKETPNHILENPFTYIFYILLHNKLNYNYILHNLQKIKDLDKFSDTFSDTLPDDFSDDIIKEYFKLQKLSEDITQKLNQAKQYYEQLITKLNSLTTKTLEEWYSPTTRFNFFLKKKVNEFYNLDASGGKSNSVLGINVSKQTTLDNTVWNTGTVSSGDKTLQNNNMRKINSVCNLFEWDDTKKFTESDLKKNDFIPCLIHDFVTQYILNRIIEIFGKDNFDKIKEYLLSLIEKSHKCNKIKEKLIKELPDLAVLIEVNKNATDLSNILGNNCPLPELVENGYKLVNHSSCDIAFLVKHAHEDITNPIIIFGNNYLIWKCKYRGNFYYVIGVHLPAAGKIDECKIILNEIKDKVKKHPILVLAGDFNLDMRQIVSEIFSELTGPPNEDTIFTCNKTRSIFQAQLTKANIKDATFKDAIYFEKDFSQYFRVTTNTTGYLSDKNLTLPSLEIPSDHSPIIMTVTYDSDEQF